VSSAIPEASARELTEYQSLLQSNADKALNLETALIGIQSRSFGGQSKSISGMVAASLGADGFSIRCSSNCRLPAAL
jgi:hypothetical protein